MLIYMRGNGRKGYINAMGLTTECKYNPYYRDEDNRRKISETLKSKGQK